MSKFGLKIKNYEAGSIYEVMQGVRNNYDTTDAMLTNSLFSEFIVANGLNVYKEVSTRDIICIEFNYGSRSFKKEINHLNKIKNECEDEEKKKRIQDLIEMAESNKDKFKQVSQDDIRIQFYENGVDIKYPIFGKEKKIIDYDVYHYRMLYRTPGKAKKGSCIFIVDKLYDVARNFLYMGLKLPDTNAPIVEIGAYSSLITSTIESTVTIKPEEILIIDDIDCEFTTNILSIGIDKNKQCTAEEIDNYTLSNCIFDGQALIDESIFPEYANGYILLRHHFTKMAAFHTKIQKFFIDKFGSQYENAKLKDVWGKEHYAKDIKLITTPSAIKWVKFKVSYDYWSEWVRATDASSV